MDVVRRFVSDNIVTGPGLYVQTKTLYEVFKDWCNENDEEALGKIKFNERLRTYGHDHGPKKVSGSTVRYTETWFKTKKKAKEAEARQREELKKPKISIPAEKV
jgi:hypothetical protein